MSMMLADERKKRVLGITSTGFPLYGITFAETAPGADGGQGQQGTDPGKTNEGANTGGEGGTGDGAAGGSGSTTDPGKPPEGESEADVWRRRAEAADRSKGDIEKELNKLKDKERTELERAAAKIEEYERTIADITEARDAALIQVEILKYPGYEWHDPDTLLRLIDRSAIEIGDDGRVSGVKDAVKKLADGSPYLLKSKPGDKKDEGKKQQATNGGTPSGQQPGSGAPNQDAEQRQKLEKQYKLHSY